MFCHMFNPWSRLLRSLGRATCAGSTRSLAHPRTLPALFSQQDSNLSKNSAERQGLDCWWLNGHDSSSYEIKPELGKRRQVCFRFFHRFGSSNTLDQKSEELLQTNLMQSMFKAFVDILFPAIFPFTLLGKSCS